MVLDQFSLRGKGALVIGPPGAPARARAVAPAAGAARRTPPAPPFAKPIQEVSPDEWRRVMDVNLTGVFLACRAAAAPMLSQGSGRIINIVSLLAERGMAKGAARRAAPAGG